MRLFFTLITLTIAAPALAADCTSADITGGGTYTCDNLYINTPISLTAQNTGTPIVINASGNVEINANITLDGGAGSQTQTGAGGVAGPGGGNGGGFSLGSTEDGQDGVTSNGKTTSPDVSCANGGGGGGFQTAGSPGVVCSTGTQPQAAGGANPPPAGEFDISSLLFRGGYGGGAGAYANDVTFGSGGGGGGGLFITANGMIKVKGGVRISARGGNGGATNTDGGGGGAGSGGVIYLKSSTGLSNFGTFDVTGGTGGRNTTTAAHGGNGGGGLYYFDDAGAITSGTGVTTFGSGSSSLKSDISCGTIAKPKEHKQLLFQVMMGFTLAMMLSFLFKNRFLKLR